MLRLLVLSVAVVCANAMVCWPGICDHNMPCDAVTAENCVGGTIVKNGGFCGCCDICQKPLVEGDSCVHYFIMGSPDRTRCGEGLRCNPDSLTCQKVHTARTTIKQLAQTCAERLQEIQRGQTNGLPLLGQFVPSCESDGSYSARQCHGSVCYCVDPQGEKINGYEASIGQSANMDCQCARDQHAFRKKYMVGKMFFCTSNGSYERYACTGSVCYCADQLGAQKAGSPTVHISNLNSLRC